MLSKTSGDLDWSMVPELEYGARIGAGCRNWSRVPEQSTYRSSINVAKTSHNDLALRAPDHDCLQFQSSFSLLTSILASTYV